MRRTGGRRYIPRAVWALAAVGGALGSGLANARSGDPFAQADLIDSIGLSRLADSAGDEALRSALENPVQRARALAAARAAAYAHAPEQLVPALLTLATGRDPALAPEAAMALVEIGRRLTPVELAAREVLRADLSAAQRAVEAALAEGRALRSDIQVALEEFASELKALQV